MPDVTRDEEELVATAMRALVRRAGRRGYLVGAVTRLLRGGAHELDLTVPVSAEVVAERADAALSGPFGEAVRADGRVRGLVAAGPGGVPVVVTVDLAADPAGGTAVRVRAAVKAVVAAQRTAEQAAHAVADQLTPSAEHPTEHPADQLGDQDGEPAAETWFVVDPSDAAELSAAELAFAAELRAHSAGWTPTDVSGFIAGREADGVTGPLIACADLTDPGNQDRLLASVGVHLLGDRVRGDRLHSQVQALPARPSAWALDVTGDRDELVAAAAEWFRVVLAKPVVLYVWLRGDRAYAGRYAFADTDETLVQLYTRELAPPGQAEELIAAGHVHGRGWIQTTGLPTPSCYVHVRGDLAAGSVPAGVPVVTRRGPLPGLWYEGGVAW